MSVLFAFGWPGTLKNIRKVYVYRPLVQHPKCLSSNIKLLLSKPVSSESGTVPGLLDAETILAGVFITATVKNVLWDLLV